MPAHWESKIPTQSGKPHSLSNARALSALTGTGVGLGMGPEVVQQVVGGFLKQGSAAGIFGMQEMGSRALRAFAL